MMMRQKSTESTDISSDSGHSNSGCNDSNKIGRSPPKTTTSSTTRGSSLTDKNKVVKFAASVKAKKTLHVKNYTLDELSDTWYDKDEIEELRHENQLTIAHYYHSKRMKLTIHNKENNATTNIKIDQTDEEEELFCYRGLEKKGKRFVKYNETQRLAINAVMQEQNRQRASSPTSGVNKKNMGPIVPTSSSDPAQRIAIAYSKVAKACVRESIKIGMQDQQDSLEYLKGGATASNGGKPSSSKGSSNTNTNQTCGKELGESTACEDRSKALLARRKARMRQQVAVMAH